MARDVCIKANSYCPVCRGIVGVDCWHEASQFHAGSGYLDDLLKARQQLAAALAERNEDMENVGLALLDTLRRNCPDYSWNDSPAEIVVDLLNDKHEAIAERELVVNWVCHNGGLLNEWAAEWRPGRETCTAYIRRRLEAAIAAGGEEKT